MLGEFITKSLEGDKLKPLQFGIFSPLQLMQFYDDEK